MKRPSNGIVLPPMLPAGFSVTCRVCNELILGDAPPALGPGVLVDAATLDDARFINVMAKVAAHINLRHPPVIQAALPVVMSYQTLLFAGCCDPVSFQPAPMSADEVTPAAVKASEFRGWDSEPFASCMQRARAAVLKGLEAKFLIEVTPAAMPPANLKGGH